MKKRILYLSLFALVWIPWTVNIFALSCARYKFVSEWLTWEELRFPVSSAEITELQQPANIALYKNFLLVSDDRQGIHIFDNSDPQAPMAVTFIPIPGAKHFDIKDDLLYARAYTDLVVVDISSPSAAYEVGRLENLFHGEDTDTRNGIATEYAYRYQSCGKSRSGGMCSSGGGHATPGYTSSPTARVGSMAALMVVGESIYSVSDQYLSVISIEDPINPELIYDEVVTTAELETVYLDGNNLFLGSRVGVYIYSIQDPALPEWVGQFEHAWQCDPVVVSGQYAFATLRSGAGCGGLANQLDILSVEDPASPTLLESYEFESPHGLAVEDDIVFLADGSNGLQLLRFEPPSSIAFINSLQTYTRETSDVVTLHASDVLVSDGVGILIGDTGVVQFGYSDLDALDLLSVIEANPSESH